MATHSSVLPWRIPGTGEPAGLPSMGRTESDMTEVTQQQQHETLTKAEIWLMLSNDDEDNIDSAYHWALSRAIGCVRSDINFYEAQSTLLNILKDSNISDTDCRNKCVKYLESKMCID